MPREGDTEFHWLKAKAKVDTPTNEINFGGQYGNNGYSSRSFSGVKAGLSANASLINIEHRVSDNWNSTVGANGPSLGGSLGFRAGSDNEVAAIVEPSLVKVDGNIGAAYGSVGLNATTGLKANKEGFKAGILGFGLTWGIGGKFTLDTPVGSLGAATLTLTDTHRNTEVQYAS